MKPVLPPRCGPRERAGRPRWAPGNRTQYLRILRRGTGEGARWYAMHSGHPARGAWRTAVAGFDLGPSTIAGASGADPLSERSCPKIQEPAPAIRRLHRGVDRFRHAIIAAAFASDGTTPKGTKFENGLRCHRRDSAAPARAMGSFHQPPLEPPDLRQREVQGPSHKGPDAHA